MLLLTSVYDGGVYRELIITPLSSWLKAREIWGEHGGLAGSRRESRLPIIRREKLFWKRPFRRETDKMSVLRPRHRFSNCFAVHTLTQLRNYCDEELTFTPSILDPVTWPKLTHKSPAFSLWRAFWESSAFPGPHSVTENGVLVYGRPTERKSRVFKFNRFKLQTGTK